MKRGYYCIHTELIVADPINTKEGEISEVSAVKPTEDEVAKAIESFVGEISQVPPAFSALKVNGVRAYDLARKGKEVVLQPRTVMIYEISKIKYNYPQISFVAHVGSGTYIRSLARDIGEKLGVGAYMSNLRRTKIGQVEIAKAYELSSLTEENIQKTLVEK